MTNIANKRIIKRKNDVLDLKVEPTKKALKKNEIQAQYNSLLQKYEELANENVIPKEEKKQNFKAMCMLEETIKILGERTDSKNVDKNSVTV